MRSCAVWLLVLGLLASPAMGLDGNKNEQGTESATQSELREMRELIRAQAAQLEEQRKQLQQEHERVQALEQKMGLASKPSAQVPAASAQPAAAAPAGANALLVKKDTASKSAPLSFKIGAADFTPGGYLAFDALFRSAASGSDIATKFENIPFNNTAAGALSEFRVSARKSNISLKVDVNAGSNKVLGYIETDFSGYQPTSGYVATNSNSLRMRQYFLDLQHGKWEVLAGQAWTMLTPSRRGINPMPSDLFLANNADSGYQVGLTWARQPQFRVVYHPSHSWALGVSIENPEQYTGSSVAFPAQLSSTSTQFDNGSNTATPNARPDIIAKVAHDQKLGHGLAWHVDAAGLMTTFKVATPATSTHDWITRTATGGGVSFNNILDLSKSFRLVGTTFWSDGGGRYIGALGPAAVVRPIGSGKEAIAQPGLVHSGSAIAGFEWDVEKNTQVSGYYSGAYFQRYAVLDTTSTTPGAQVGFGYTPLTDKETGNRTLQEATFNIRRTLWKDPTYGALQFATQTSYVSRAPWYVKPGAPKNAHLVLQFMELRYVLP